MSDSPRRLSAKICKSWLIIKGEQRITVVGGIMSHLGLLAILAQGRATESCSNGELQDPRHPPTSPLRLRGRVERRDEEV